MSAETIVLDVNVLVNAVAPQAQQSWDASVLDPTKNKTKQGLLARAILTILSQERSSGSQRYTLVANEHVMTHVDAVLSGAEIAGRARTENKGWSREAASQYVRWIDDLAHETGGNAWFESTTENAALRAMFPENVWTRVGGTEDHEDRSILALARESGATVIVTSDVNFLSLGSSLGFVRVISPERFLEEHLRITY